MARVKQSWRVRVNRSRGMGTLADTWGKGFPSTQHPLNCRQELGCFQPSNAFPQFLAGAGRSLCPPLRAAKHQRHQCLTLPHMASGEETSMSATSGVPTGSLGLPPPVSLWIRLISTHAGGKKEQNRMLQVCYLISVKREVLFESMEGFIPAVQRQQSCWSNSVLGIVSISPVPTEGSVSSLRPPLRVGKMLLTRNLCNIYIWERQFLTLAGLSQFTAIEQWSELLGNTSSKFSAL